MVYKENSYEMDYVAFEKAIVENDVKMFILCNPYNPIGKVWKEDELKQIGEICKKHHVLVIVDEIHEDFVYGDHIHIPFYNVDESYKEFSVVLTAPSKTFNLAGLQTSNIIIADEKLRKAYQETMNRYGVNEPNFLGIIACMTAYNECELWVDEMLEYVYDNFTYFDEFLKELSRSEIISKSLENYGYILVADSIDEAIEVANDIASEHLEIVTKDPFNVMTKIKNAGAIFLGEYSSEPLGDYFAGPNHVLPTNGTAKFFSPLSVDDFIKKSSIISYSREALELIHNDIETFAKAEHLTAHANSIHVRFEGDK